jgi:hemolysin activation/secretion protein
MKKNLIFIATLSLMAGATSAQTVPNAGVLLNQHKQGAPKNDDSLVSASSDQQVVFKGFSYEGLTPEQMAQANAITAEYLNKEVFAGQLIKHLEFQLERLHGVSVVFQEMPDGTLKAIRPILGAIHIDNQSSLKETVLRHTLQRGVELGKTLNRSALEARSMLTNEIPGVVNQYRMAPGAALGSTDLHVTTTDGKRSDGYVGLDNNGTSAVGIWELLGGISGNNLLGIGDRITLNGLKSQNGQYVGISADAPVGMNDWRMGFNASTYRYAYHTQGLSNIGSAMDSKYSGKANDLGVNVTYALARSEFERTNLSLAYNHKVSRSNVDVRAKAPDGSISTGAFDLSNWVIDAVTLGFNGLHAMSDRAMGSYNLSMSAGHATQKNESEAVKDGAGAKQQGNYAKINVQGAYTRPFQVGEGHYIFTASAAAQLSHKNLPNSEKMYVGGQNMMKAWSPQTTGGDNALWLEVKAEKYLTDKLKVGVFAEIAHLAINAKPYGAMSPNGTAVQFNDKNTLSDVGLSLNYLPVQNFEMSGSVAVQTSKQAVSYGMPIASTNDQKKDVMVFVKAMYRF